MCGAKNPETLTSSRFRKQIATILQIMNFEADEMEQIATFMGHTEKTHKEFYWYSLAIYVLMNLDNFLIFLLPFFYILFFSRMPDVYQTAKILMLLNEGKGEEFKGKSLAEIEISGDLLEFEKDEEEEIEKN